jgi:hypothetical protein
MAALPNADVTLRKDPQRRVEGCAYPSWKYSSFHLFLRPSSLDRAVRHRLGPHPALDFWLACNGYLHEINALIQPHTG